MRGTNPRHGRAHVLRRTKRLVRQGCLELLLLLLLSGAGRTGRPRLRLRRGRAGLAREEDGRGVCGGRASSVSCRRAARSCLTRPRALQACVGACRREPSLTLLMSRLAPVAVLGPKHPARLGRLLLLLLEQCALASSDRRGPRGVAALAGACGRLVMERVVCVRVLLVVIEPGRVRAAEHPGRWNTRPDASKAGASEGRGEGNR